MADYSSGAIYFTGLGSGTNFDSVIEATIAAESHRLTNYKAQKETFELKAQYIQDVNTAVSSLSTVLSSLDSVGDFLAMAATSTTEALGVSADGDAGVGSHTVTVNQLAQNDIWVNTGTGESSADAVITASNASFTYEYAGESHTINVSAGTTLEELAERITNFEETKGDVRASVVYDGSSYHLKIYGMDQGADYGVSVTSSTISGYGASDFENTQAAQNAQIKVDGYPPGANDWMERSSNTIDDVIDGVTLTLNDTCMDAKVNITQDSDAIVEHIETLVDALNKVYSYIDALTKVTGSGEDAEGSTFTGNYGIRLAESLLKTASTSKPGGFEYYDATTGLGDLYSALSQIGVITDADEDSETFGLLIIDYEELNKALGKDSEAVALLFSANGEGSSLSDDFSYVSAVPGITEGGEYGVEYLVSNGSIVWAVIDGEEAEVNGLEITSKSGDAAGLCVRVTNTADGSYSGKAVVKEGVIPTLAGVCDDLIDGENGLLKIMEENYDDQVADMTERIEDEQERLDAMETRLRNKYAKLESTLGKYDDISDSLTSYLKQLLGSSSSS